MYYICNYVKDNIKLGFKLLCKTDAPPIKPTTVNLRIAVVKSIYYRVMRKSHE